MKGLIIYVKESSFNAAKQILIDKQVEGITYFDIMGQGHLDREATERIVQGYKTGEKYTPEFARRTRIETIVDDDKANSIIEALKAEGDIHGKVFTFDVTESHEL
ncbi:P-II family nitrogen regulator [Candidatus Nitrosocosmicus franklandus]|uniref:Nitrogen regulatory protein P-II n=1 Tax=Candidatus Nitrosocosmicus franklandianus TaxID=1798806 RepID=A0A484IKD5_9ARCH|nr:P-II family nitrogen regulator [Candidatus Nitrosocosmicus franklandus]VFJ15369.1 Nitrogen regulatory protein P-II [Candidatus Nitrosocosmicus franklandus]